MTHTTPWSSIIQEYIDGLDEADKYEIMHDNILSYHYCKYCQTATADNQEEQKRLQKMLRPIKKIKFRNLNEKIKDNLKQAKNTYHNLLEQGWLSDEQSGLLQSIARPTNFYNTWINHLLIQINNDITPATHVAKLTHSSSKASSLIDTITDTDTHYLTTSSLSTQCRDGAYPGAQYSKIAKFLLLEHNGVLLGEILNQDISPLTEFARDQAEMTYWKNEFQRRLHIQPSADALAKQVYFPVGEDDYHLLVVLKSSSLVQEIYNTCFIKSVREERERNHKQYEAEKYSDAPYMTYPNAITLSTVQSKPQNVSVLSGRRGGNIRLFSCQPPLWQSQIKPPLLHKTCFNDKRLSAQCRDDIAGLHNLLLTFQKADISIKNPARLRGIIHWCHAIAESIINYAQRLLTLPPGWTASSDCKLNLTDQYFLDPYRQEAAYQRNRQHHDWHVQLTDEFVSWLNTRLQKMPGNLQTNAEHSRIWRAVFAKIIRQYKETLDADKQATGR